jgi:hypothetical protein
MPGNTLQRTGIRNKRSFKHSHISFLPPDGGQGISRNKYITFSRFFQFSIKVGKSLHVSFPVLASFSIKKQKKTGNFTPVYREFYRQFVALRA